MRCMAKVLGQPEDHHAGKYTQYFFREAQAADGPTWRLMADLQPHLAPLEAQYTYCRGFPDSSVESQPFVAAGVPLRRTDCMFILLITYSNSRTLSCHFLF